ncbi:MAG: hypothetical protein RLZZ528_898 [Pseudomonadota bacterium]|jgi:hypothetical protein
MIHRTARRISTLWIAATLAATGWTLSQNPFAAPVIARSADEIRLSVERIVAREVTAEWLALRMEAALAAEDLDRARLLADLAADRGIALPPELAETLAAREAEAEGLLATLTACGSCAVDIGSCPSLGMIGACALPFELSPAGDVAALGRAGVAAVTEEPVDRVEAALAAVGLTATVATVATAGSSATVKVGATVLRVARRMDALTPGLARAVERAATSGATDEVVALATDFGRLRGATSSAEALSLLRLADTPADLTRLSRLAEATGPDTRRAVEVLGKARALRIVDRVAGLTLAAFGLLAVAAAQLAGLLGLLLRWVVAPLRHPPPARRRR